VSAPFVQSVRTRREPINLSRNAESVVNLRVEVPEVWDVVQVRATDATPVLDVKVAALAALLPAADETGYVMKLRGWEVLDEGQSVADVGAIDGSIFLLTNRRRRPVR
jgi:hypothetical protein